MMHHQISALVYDIEIVKAISKRGEARVDGIEYCEGWDDKANMGISVIGAYDYETDAYRVFCADNFGDFEKLVDERDCIIGFNHIRFDNEVVLAELGFKFDESKCYDILLETWLGLGLSIEKFKRAHGGYGLDLLAEANLGAGKTGNGALAPVEWQQGKIGQVIDYCLNDVKLTKGLFDILLLGDPLISPKTGDEITLRPTGFKIEHEGSEVQTF